MSKHREWLRKRKRVDDLWPRELYDPNNWSSPYAHDSQSGVGFRLQSNTSNLLLAPPVFALNVPNEAYEKTLRLSGVADKLLLLLLVTLTAAALTWDLYSSIWDPAPSLVIGFGGLVFAFLFGLLAAYFKAQTKYFSFAFATLIGLALGSISAWTESLFPGIAVQAVCLTAGVLLALILIYRFFGGNDVDTTFIGIIGALCGVGVVYLVSFVAQQAGWGFNYPHQVHPLGGLVLLVVLAGASVCMLFNFEALREKVAEGAPRYLEWYGAFAILGTLVWLYLDMVFWIARARSKGAV